MTIVDIVTIITLGIFVVVISIFGVAFYKLIFSSLKFFTGIGKETHVNVRNTVRYDAAIDKILYLLRLELNSVDVYLARFHNGGHFNNGTRMQKFSITHGKAASTIELLQTKFYDIFVSHYPDVMDHLILVGDYCVSDIEDCRDANFRKDMMKYEFKAVYLFLICQDDAERTPEGFIAVNFNHTHVMTVEDRSRVMIEIPRLLGLLNLISDSLNKK